MLQPVIVCVDGYVKSAGDECVECNGSVLLSFAFPLGVLLCFIFAAIYWSRVGHMNAVVDALFEGAKESQGALEASTLEDTTLDDAAEAAKEQIADDVISTVAPAPLASQEDASINDSTQPRRSGPDRPLHVANVAAGAIARGVPSPPPSPPSSPMRLLLRRVSSLSLSTPRSSIDSAGTAAASIGLTKKRMIGLQVKLRILIGLIQVEHPTLRRTTIRHMLLT